MNTLSQVVMQCQNALVGERAAKREAREFRHARAVSRAWRNRHKILASCDWNAHKLLADAASKIVAEMAGFCPSIGEHNLADAVRIAELWRNPAQAYPGLILGENPIAQLGNVKDGVIGRGGIALIPNEKYGCVAWYCPK